MNNVYRFPKGKELPKPVDADSIKTAAAFPVKATIKAVLAWLFLLIRLPVFLILYWLRIPVIFICNGLAAITFVCWLFSWYAFPDKTQMVWGFAVISFVAFVIAWTYDFILMVLSPQDMIKTL